MKFLGRAKAEGFLEQWGSSGIAFSLDQALPKNPNPKVSEVTQSCPILCDTMVCSPPGSSVHGIFQARVLEWGAIGNDIKMYFLLIPNLQSVLYLE